MTAHATEPLTELDQQMCALLQGTAEELWGIAATILQSGYVTADEWEMARVTLSHCLAGLQQPAFGHRSRT